MTVIKSMDIDLFKKDYDAILALRNYSSTLHFSASTEDEIRAYNERALSQVADYMAEGKAFFWGAYEDDRLIGLLWTYPRVFFNERRLFVNSIVVSPDAQRRGIGRSLMNACFAYGREKGYDAVDLTVMPNNEKALGLYENMGFTCERIQMRYAL